MKTNHLTIVGLFAALGLATAGCVSDGTEEADLMDLEAMEEDISEGDEVDIDAAADLAADESEPGVEPTFWPYGYGWGHPYGWGKFGYGKFPYGYGKFVSPWVYGYPFGYGFPGCKFGYCF